MGIDPESDGLKRAARLGVATTHEGIDGLTRMPGWKDIEIVFDATSAAAHSEQQRNLHRGRQDHDRSHAGRDRSLCHSGGQWRCASGRAQREHGDLRRPGDDSRSSPRSARSRRCIMPRSWPRSRRNPPAPAPAPISTSSPKPPRAASRRVGGAAQGQGDHHAQSAEPPMIMRDTVFTLSSGADEAQIEAVGRTPWSRRCKPMCRAIV